MTHSIARGAAAVILVITAIASGPAAAQIKAKQIATGLTYPVYATGPPGDDRVFIVLRGGIVRVYENGALLPAPFLNISSKINFLPGADEGGLLGLVFAPDYATSGVFYVYYTGFSTTSPSGMSSIVARFTVNGSPATSNDANEASETPIFALDQPYTNHNGGTIAIREEPPRRWLYLGLGDGGSYGGDLNDLAQNDASPFGKMLRLDLSTPNPDAGDWEIWAKGLRNPFRFSFDRATGDLYIGDVGYETREEIDAVPADAPPGLNFGWDVMEGSTCFTQQTFPDPDPDAFEPPCNDPSLVLPIYELGRPSCAIAGGSVYRGSASPSLRGTYFFGDWCSGRVIGLRWTPAAGLTSVEDLTQTIQVVPSQTIRQIVAISEGGDGELYIVSLLGTVWRLEAGSDRDGDGIPDASDNCSELSNPDQLDANADGYGNRCDPDFNDDGVVGLPDFNALRLAFGSRTGDPDFDAAIDLDSNGAIGLSDFNVLRAFFGSPPGPGVAP